MNVFIDANGVRFAVPAISPGPYVGLDADGTRFTFDVSSAATSIWGSITGTLTNQLDLVAALNAKVNVTSLDGGTTGQVLTKASDADGDFDWEDGVNPVNAVFITDTTDDPFDTPGFTIEPLTGTGAIEVVLPGDNITEFKIEGSDGFPAYLAVYAYGDNPSGVYPSCANYRSRGTDASPVAVLAGDTIASFAGYGYDGSAFQYGGSVSRVASENWTTSAHGTQLNLGVNRTGHAGLAESIALAITNDDIRSTFLFSPASKLRYDGAAATNRINVQATSGDNTIWLTKSPGTTSSDYSGVRSNSSSDNAHHNFLQTSAKNSNSGSGAFRVQTGKATPTTITALDTLVGGSGYDSDGVYTDVALTGGTGTGATANITVDTGAVTVVTLVLKGTGYTDNDVLSADDGDIGGRTGGDAFSVQVNGVATATTDSTDPVVFSGAVTNTVYATVNAGTAAVADTDVVRLSDLNALVLPPSTVTGLTAGTVVGQARAVTDAALGIAWCLWDGANWINTVTHSAVA